VVRRRRWSAEEKGRIVARAVVPGAVVAEVARQHDLTPQQLSNWIKAAKEGRVMLPAPEPDGDFGEATDAVFVPVVTAKAQLIQAYKDSRSPNFILYAECLQAR
jgi:transposase